MMIATICVVIKYLVGVSSIVPVYHCPTNDELQSGTIIPVGMTPCTSWLSWIGAGTSLRLWDAAAWMILMVNFISVRITMRLDEEEDNIKLDEQEVIASHSPIPMTVDSHGDIIVDLQLIGHPMYDESKLSTATPIEIVAAFASTTTSLPSTTSPSSSLSPSSDATPPSEIVVTYTTINNHLSNYTVTDFCTSPSPPPLSSSSSSASSDIRLSLPSSFDSPVSATLHYLVFRSLHYLGVILLICIVTSIQDYNIVAMAYLILAFIMVWKGDEIIDATRSNTSTSSLTTTITPTIAVVTPIIRRKIHTISMWDICCIMSFTIILIRLLFQLPIFSFALSSTWWSTIFGLYKSDGDIADRPSYSIINSSPLASDIVIFLLALIIRTVLSRAEMSYVRSYLTHRRSIAPARSRLIGLRYIHQRLILEHRERSRSIRRLERVIELKQNKIAREVTLQQDLINAGLLVASGGSGRKHDDDANAWASIRKHELNRMGSAARFGNVNTIASSRGVDKVLPNITTKRANSTNRVTSTPRTPRGGSSIDSGGGNSRRKRRSVVHETVVEGNEDDESTTSNNDDLFRSLRIEPSPSSSPDISDNDTHYPQQSPSSSPVVPVIDDSLPLRTALRSLALEILFVERKMNILRSDHTILALNSLDHLPLLLIKLNETKFVVSIRNKLLSTKHAVFQDDNIVEKVEQVDQHCFSDSEDDDDEKKNKKDESKPKSKPMYNTAIFHPSSFPLPLSSSHVHAVASSIPEPIVPFTLADVVASAVDAAASSSSQVSDHPPPPPPLPPVHHHYHHRRDSSRYEPDMFVINDVTKVDVPSSTSVPSSTGSLKGEKNADGIIIDSNDIDDDDPSFAIQLWELLSFLVLGHTHLYVYFFFLLEFLFAPSLLSMVYPFTLFLYGLLAYPRPARTYWQWMILYTCGIILLKFMFQLPAFCICDYGNDGVYYSMCSQGPSVSCAITSSIVATSTSVYTTNLPRIIGIHKYSQTYSSSARSFMSFIGSTLIDWLTLLVLTIHRRHLRTHGLWRTTVDIDRETFKDEEERKSKVEAVMRNEEEKRENAKEWHPRSYSSQLHEPLPRSSSVPNFHAINRTHSSSTNSSSSRPPPLVVPPRSTTLTSLSAPGLDSSPSSAPALSSSSSSSVRRIDISDEPRRSSHHMMTSPIMPPTHMKRLSQRRDASPVDGTPPITDEDEVGVKQSKVEPIKRNSIELEAISTVAPSSKSASSTVAAGSSSSSSPPPPLVPHRSLLHQMSSLYSTGKRKLFHSSTPSSPSDSPIGSPSISRVHSRTRSRTMSDSSKPSKPTAPVITPADRRASADHAKQTNLIAKQIARVNSHKLEKNLRRMSVVERAKFIGAAKKAKKVAAVRASNHRQRIRIAMSIQRRANASPIIIYIREHMISLHASLSSTSMKPGIDLYIYIFLIQLIQFFVLVIFFNSTSTVASIAQSNYISPVFVWVVVAQFALIIIERVIYLYRAMIWKIALQLCSMIVYFIIALYSGTSTLMILTYILMCIYWILSGIQYRYGYPLSTQGQYLANSTHFIPRNLFQFYRAIPFVFELRTLLDWICTDTVLHFGEWLKFEDIFATFFMTHCGADGTRRSPGKAGEKVKLWNKIWVGVGLFTILLIVVWGPLFLFSSQSATNMNGVTSTQMSVTMDGYATLYHTSQSYVVVAAVGGAPSDTPPSITDDQYAAFALAHPFITAQRQRDLQIIYPLSAASDLWGITPTARTQMIQQLTLGGAVGSTATPSSLQFRYDFVRSTATSAPITHYTYEYILSSQQMIDIANVISSTAAINTTTTPTSSASVLLTGCTPAFLYMSSIDAAGPVDPMSTDPATGLTNCLLTLDTAADAFGTRQEWWRITDAGTTVGVAASSFTPSIPGVSLGPPIFVYSGELPLGTSLNYGLVAVYVTVVLAIGRFLRLYVMGAARDIIWDDMLDPLPILHMCRDTYTARLYGQLKLEEQLYVELINLLRSPDEMKEKTGEFVHYWPRAPEDVEEEEEEEEENERSRIESSVSRSSMSIGSYDSDESPSGSDYDEYEDGSDDDDDDESNQMISVL